MPIKALKFSFFLATGDFEAARTAALWADERGSDALSMNDHYLCVANC